jgi:hypothetical protein
MDSHKHKIPMLWIFSNQNWYSTKICEYKIELEDITNKVIWVCLKLGYALKMIILVRNLMRNHEISG